MEEPRQPVQVRDCAKGRRDKYIPQLYSEMVPHRSVPPGSRDTLALALSRREM